RTLRNRLRKQVSRVKSPRYAIALLVGIGYLWLVFAQPGARGAPRPRADFSGIGTFGGIGLAITVFLWWVRGGVLSALAFQPAEVQFLFPAPLARRALIVYRVVRSQLPLLLSSLLWTALSHRWGVTIAAPLRFVTAWGFFSALSLHRLVAALVQLEPLSPRRLFLKRAAQVVSAAAVASIALGALPIVRQFGALWPLE